MPKRAPKPCKTEGCAGLHTYSKTEFSGYCVSCSPSAAAAHATKIRAYSKKRKDRNDVYDAFYATKAWRKCRDAFIKANPLCSHCESRGRIKPADVVDHVKERRDGGADYEWSNLQSLCHPCHNHKSAEERRKRTQRDE
jgi:5-methylcytosine-specific restriction protein A